ncbi:hypothetical protein [Streptomyces sp. NPDC048612]|uniref:hypothetical protein n=1 Tax=Streptomyces sp. NPDC048612 TaxID=3365579 RepID=UPI0037116997
MHVPVEIEFIIFISEPDATYLAEKTQAAGHQARQPDQDARRQQVPNLRLGSTGQARTTTISTLVRVVAGEGKRVGSDNLNRVVADLAKLLKQIWQGKFPNFLARGESGKSIAGLRLSEAPHPLSVE